MLLHPTFFPFQRSAERAFNLFAPAEDSGPIEPASMLNAEKLGLPLNTPVGKRVSVTDSFVVSGFGDARDGFYFPYPGDPTIFIRRLPFSGSADTRAYSDGTWHIGNDALGYADATASGGTNPWDVTYAGITLANPAVQQLAAPSTAQGGVFVAGGAQDGIYSSRGTANTKEYFGLLGSTAGTGDDAATGAEEIQWVSDLHTVDITIPSRTPGWAFFDNTGLLTYYSASVVATPDLASNWKNGDNSAASITVTSVPLGDIVAGLFVANDGGTNGSSYVSQAFHGRQYYMGLNGGGSNNMHWDTDYFIWTDDVGLWSDSNVAFPWQGVDSHVNHSGATFARNDVAAEANWQVA